MSSDFDAIVIGAGHNGLTEEMQKNRGPLSHLSTLIG
jgi:hypothetical protein